MAECACFGGGSAHSRTQGAFSARALADDRVQKVHEEQHNDAEDVQTSVCSSARLLFHFTVRKRLPQFIFATHTENNPHFLTAHSEGDMDSFAILQSGKLRVREVKKPAQDHGAGML